MKIKEMFSKINYENVWKNLYNNYFEERNYSKEKLNYFKTSLKKSINEILAISPVKDNDWIIFIDDVYDDLSTDTESIYLDSYLFKKSDILTNFKTDNIIENNISIESWSINEITDYFKSRSVIVSYGYEFTPWKEIVDFDIWDGSIKEYGIDTCAAAILFEMTFCGFSQKEVEKKTDEIFNRNTDSDNSIDLEEFLEDETDETDDFLEPSEEEKEENFRQSLIISQKNYISIYKKTKEFYKESKKE